MFDSLGVFSPPSPDAFAFLTGVFRCEGKSWDPLSVRGRLRRSAGQICSKFKQLTNSDPFISPVPKSGVSHRVAAFLFERRDSGMKIFLIKSMSMRD